MTFYVFQFQSPFLMASKAPPRRFRDDFWFVLVDSGTFSGLPKTVIPYGTSFKNRAFKALRFQHSSCRYLRSVLERLEAPWEHFSEAFWIPFEHFDAGTYPPIRICLVPLAWYAIFHAGDRFLRFSGASWVFFAHLDTCFDETWWQDLSMHRHTCRYALWDPRTHITACGYRSWVIGESSARGARARRF